MCGPYLLSLPTSRVFVTGIALLGVIYLWRWTTLPMVADEANGINDVDAGRF